MDFRADQLRCVFKGRHSTNQELSTIYYEITHKFCINLLLQKKNQLQIFPGYKALAKKFNKFDHFEKLLHKAMKSQGSIPNTGTP